MGNINEHISILDLDEIKKYNQNYINYLLYSIDNKEMIHINLNEKFYFNVLNFNNLVSYLPDQIYKIPDDINVLFIKDINNETNKINLIIKSNMQPTTNTYFFIKNVLLNKHEFSNEITNYTALLEINGNKYNLNVYYINSFKPLKYYVQFILNNIDNKKENYKENYQIKGGRNLNFYYNYYKKKYY